MLRLHSARTTRPTADQLGAVCKWADNGVVTVGRCFYIHHYSAFKRVAVVTDKQWIVHAVHALAWMVPGEFKVFGLDELDGAARWVAAD